MLSRFFSSILPVALLVFAGGPALAQTAGAPVCVHDDTVKERFIPVEMLTGNLPMQTDQLVMAPVDRVYPFVDELPNGTLGGGDVTLKGPVAWESHQAYQRKVPRANELYALTPDKTALGRVHDDRVGTISNEGKFPVGQWAQGQKRSYSTIYYSTRGERRESTTLEIEKLSCVYEGTPGAMQYGWKTASGTSYGYIYVPGKGLTHVMTRVGGR
ncbi:MAG: hypothetical protein EOO28_08480 [Comamonadaceae bacterium]|nr:MAG: hypothetical protein EOO28_08480 [Comamonadaceae bacterium]